MKTPAKPLAALEVSECSEHYLDRVSCRIPHDSLTVVSGVSGSGKSSLVFDTICREGQRRFLETLSLQARGVWGTMKQPAGAVFKNLRPTLAVAQKGPRGQARSTVGTLTDLADSLRLLFARLGTPHCPTCRKPYQAQTLDELITRLRNRFPGQALVLAAPIISGHCGRFRKELEQLRKQGFAHVRLNGILTPLDPLPELDPKTRQTIDVIVSETIEPEHPDFPLRVETALKLGKRTLLFGKAPAELQRATLDFSCLECGAAPPEIGPRLFSFNSPYGACPACNGLGVESAIDPELLIGNPDLSLRQGALVLTTPKPYIMYSQVTMDVLNQVCQAHEFSVDIPWRDLTDEQRHVVFFGSERLKIPFGKHPLESRLKWTGITARPREEEYYKGIIPVMTAILQRDPNPNILKYVRQTTCRSCRGTRLNEAARAVFFHEKSISDLTAWSLRHLHDWLRRCPLTDRERPVAEPLFAGMLAPLERLLHLGLGHLSLDRDATTLAGGEWQRIRLALQTFSRLSGLLYVLDEPSLGLHPRDQERLLDLLVELRNAGNTVLAVEHRREALLAADWLIDLGPGAGPHGGRLLYQGPPAELLGAGGPSHSPTRNWLAAGALANQAQDSFHRVPRGEAIPTTGVVGSAGAVGSVGTSPGPSLEIIGAAQNNLRNLSVTFPLQRLIAVTGVSGAGKSTLVHQTLGTYLRRHFHGATEIPGAFGRITGHEHLNKVIVIDQTPIGRSPRSNPSTYTGVFDHIRDLFARQPLAQSRGWSKSRFSWNVVGGRCEACQGSGIQEIGLHLLDPVGVICEACQGRRYLPDTLEVLFREHSISSVLDLTIAEALDLFADQPRIHRILSTLNEVGLGYLTLGQSSTTLSGGEAQRVKLATELARAETGKTLYILDEPATGLHHEDIQRLSAILHRLVQAGNTVIAVEHHPEFLWTADWIIDLGPEGGDDGGQLVAAGTPSDIMQCPASHTGRMLAQTAASTTPAFCPRPQPHATSGDSPSPVSAIELRGVATHNLRHLDVSFPKGLLTVVTGVSGSGKSSLVMGTLQAESHRRYVESLSAYARSFIQTQERPCLTGDSGLTPVIALTAAPRTANPRSTVGTFSRCHDFLRILFSRAGTRYCPMCTGSPSRTSCLDPDLNSAATFETPSHSGAETNSVAGTHAEPARQRLLPTSPPICPTCGFVGTILLQAQHFSGNHAEGACPHCHGLGVFLSCDPDRLIAHPHKPLTEGALDGSRVGRFYGEPDGQYIAMLRAVGAELGFEYSRPWNELPQEARQAALFGCGDRVFTAQWQFKRGKRTGAHTLTQTWPGFLRLVEDEFARKRSDQRAEGFVGLMRADPCPECGGDRIGPEARAVRWGGLSLGELCRLPLHRLPEFFEQASSPPPEPTPALADHPDNQTRMPPAFTAREQAISRPLLQEALSKIHDLLQAGLGYLTLDRPLNTLSGGEFRRLLLAGHLGGELSGVTYLLDEPTIGLHPSDTAPLIRLLQRLRNLGNTLIVIEHDPEVIRAADHIIEIGPGAGIHGGRVTAAGDVKTILASSDCLTAAWVNPGRDRSAIAGQDTSHAKRSAVPAAWPSAFSSPLRHPGIEIRTANRHNLRNLDVSIPLGGLVVLSGVSGSGKSTLVEEILLPSWLEGRPVGCRAFTRPDDSQRLIFVDQSLPTGSEHSLVGTLTGALDVFRDLFAASPAARQAGLAAAAFSPFSPAGRCPKCQGLGVAQVDLDFLAEVRLVCEECSGSRFQPGILEYRIGDLSIADVLSLSLDELNDVFRDQARVRHALQPFFQVGLGHLALGRSTATLSAGERQRLRFVMALGEHGDNGRNRHSTDTPNSTENRRSKTATKTKLSNESCFFVFDEPTTGLHLADVARLLGVFADLIRHGHSILVVEHHLDVISRADWIIDLGPGGGDEGGRLVAAGTPEQLRAHPNSATGEALRTHRQGFATK